MKSRKKHFTRRRVARILRVLLVLLVLTTIGFVAFMKLDYLKRPGLLDRDTVRAVERGTDHITLEWEAVRNADNYDLMYKETGSEDEWQLVEIKAEEEYEEGQKAQGTVGDLKEGTSYSFTLRAHNSEKKGQKIKGIKYKTRSHQTISVNKDITKMKSAKKFKLRAKAQTSLKYSSSNTSVAKVDKLGNVTIKKAGIAKIRITATETKSYVEAHATVKLTVLDMYGTTGGSARIIKTLGKSNCSRVIAVTGSGGIHCPQSLAYTGDKYIIAYNNGKGTSATRIITFDKNGKKLKVVPTSSWGHPNGFTYCEKTGLCYALRGNSTRVDVYNPKTDAIGVTTMTYGAAGICYDPARKKIYTTSGTGVRTYTGDGKFNHERLMSNCSHSGKTYTQDSGAYNGLVFRCMSGPNKHGQNFVDIYDTRTAKYMGSFEVYLGEVESAVVNDDGYLLLLVNGSGRTDYIWNTHINVKSLSQ